MIRTPFFLVPAGLAVAGLSLASNVLSAGPRLDELVPAGQAVVLAVEDLPAVRERFEQSPYGRAWADPDVARFWAPFWQIKEVREWQTELRDETGMGLVELAGLISGDLLFCARVEAKSDGELGGRWLFAAEVGEAEARLRDVLERGGKRLREGSGHEDPTEDYNGVMIHRFATVSEAGVAEGGAGGELFWALHEARWFVASERQGLTAVLDALAAGGLASPLAGSPGYRGLLDEAGPPGDFAFLVDVQAIYPVLSAWSADKRRAGAAAASGLDATKMLEALRLDVLEGLSGRGGFDAEGGVESSFAIRFSEPRGLAGLLAYVDGPVGRPEWVPASWVEVSTLNFSVAELYAELERMVSRASPFAAALMLGQIQSFDQQLKIDLRRDLVGGFGPSMISGVALPPGARADRPPAYDQMEQFLAIELRDPAAFERMVEAIKGRFLPAEGGPVERREYLGRVLYVYDPPGEEAGAGFAYAIADGWLWVSVGSAAPLEAVLQGVHQPGALASFWERADARLALERVPSAACSVQIADFATALAALAEWAAREQREAGEGPVFVDVEAVPDREVFARYFSLITTYAERGPEGLRFRTFVPPAP